MRHISPPVFLAVTSVVSFAGASTGGASRDPAALPPGVGMALVPRAVRVVEAVLPKRGKRHQHRDGAFRPLRKGTYTDGGSTLTVIRE